MAVRKENATPQVSATPAAAHKDALSQRLRVVRRFTRPDVHPYDEVAWHKRSATIQNEKGEVIFEQTDVEIPTAWSQMATNVVVSKYFHGPHGTPQR